MLAQGQVNGHNMLKMSKENFTCSKEKIMRKELSSDLTVLKSYINSFENSMKQGIFSFESSADLDQLAFSDAMLNNISDIIVFLYISHWNIGLFVKLLSQTRINMFIISHVNFPHKTSIDERLIFYNITSC